LSAELGRSALDDDSIIDQMHFDAMDVFVAGNNICVIALIDEI
jgi:hypothetical protein